MKYQLNQEEQAKCPHAKAWITHELMLNKWKTGDKICKCGKTFAPGEEIIPVEYRTQMIMTPHALLTAVKLNDDLELLHNPDPPVRKFAWALVSKSTGRVMMGVACEVAEDCVGRGYIQKVEFTPPVPEKPARRRRM